MRRSVTLISLVLAACSSAGDEAKEEYEMVDAAQPDTIDGDYARCDALRKVAQGYLSDKNNEEYQRAQLRASITCQNVRLRDEVELR